jgi:hypothetical protein
MLYTVYQEFEAHFTNQVRADGVVWWHPAARWTDKPMKPPKNSFFC